MKRFTISEILIAFKLAHGDLYNYSLFVKYNGHRDIIGIICKDHGKFNQQIYNHMSGRGCLKCGKSQRFTKTYYINKANIFHNYKYNYCLMGEYKNIKSKIKIICPNHGLFFQTAESHLLRGCSKCRKRKINTCKPRPIFSMQSIIDKFIAVHGNIYDYNLSVAKCMKDKIIIICKDHGQFVQRITKHLCGQGCMKCGLKKRSKSRAYTKEEYFRKSNIFHNYKYGYELSNYVGVRGYLTIRCPTHGYFKQKASKHLVGGCTKCGHEKLSKLFSMTSVDFFNRIKEKYGDKYNHNQIIFKTLNDKIKIICDRHGLFIKTAKDYLNGAGCQKCNHRISKKETLWLDSLNVPQEIRNIKIIINGRTFYPDAIDIKNKIVYEFYGDFWHGNINRYKPQDFNKVIGKTFQELYNKTQNKENAFKLAGYSIVKIWESDFDKLNAEAMEK